MMPTMNNEARLTVEVIRARRWQCVRLCRRGKKPEAARDGHWQTTTDADAVARWFASGSNVGLVCHERSGVAVLDPDQPPAWAHMIEELGQPCLPWVLTGSGKLHYYIAWEPLPAKIVWRNEIIGEIQRGPGQQQVVLPGSVHPVTGLTYRWIREPLGFLCEPIDPVQAPLPELPGLWRAFFRGQMYAADAR
jgi:Bifunctional DNA primase/polymerase, N-terminal